jgi:predicted MFS family arabinose efflux permease
VSGDRRAFAAGLAAFINFINLYTPQAILPVLTAEFAVAPARTGLTVTAPLIAVALVAPFAGAVSDRVGRKRLIVGASLLLSLPTLVLALAPNFEVFLLARFAQGLLLPFIFTVTVAYIGEELQGQAAVPAAGVYTIGSIFGGFGGRFIAGIAADLAGWRVAFLVITAVTLAGALLLAVVLPREQRFRPVTGGLGASLAAYARHLGNARFLGTCAIGFGMLFSNVAVFTFVNFHLSAPPYNLSTSALSFVFAVYLVGIVTTAIAMRLMLRIGRVATLALALGLAGVGLCTTLAPSLPVAILGLAGLSGGLFVTQTLCINFIGATISRAKSSAVGFYVTMFYIGGALGGVVAGLAFHAFGWLGVVALVIGVLAMMLGIAGLAWRRPG